MNCAPILPTLLALCLAFTASLSAEDDARLHSDGKGWRLEQAKITDPSRPRVLLIGDSILNGYQKQVITALEGKAYVDSWVNPYHQSEHLNQLLAEVLAKGPYDFVHFNMGLHGWQEGRIQPGTFEPLTEAYVGVLKAKLPKAALIWANSTPVTVKGKPTELDPTINPVIIEHNRMADAVMVKLGVPVNDFYGLLVNRLDLARGDSFHWTAPAYEILAGTVVESVLSALGEKAPSASPPAPEMPPGYDPAKLPKGHDYFELRDGLANARRKFTVEKKGRIAFLGGSITAGGGWRDHTMEYFRKTFPETEFEFIAAGIGSLGSVPHAFRLERDVLSKVPVDLLFVEAAVNDSSNIPGLPDQMLRGMEGVVRHAREVNPLTDIVHLHFAMPPHLDDFRAGRVPVSIAQHEKVASAYGNPSLDLSREVTERIDAGQFTWEGDFKNLHPSPFGHRLYADSIARMLDAAFAGPVAEAAKPHALPAPVDPKSYARGRFGNLASARLGAGFVLDPAWKATDGKGTRAGFVNVPALVATEPGAEFSFDFEGTGCGLFLAAGPDAGRIEYQIDGGEWRTLETFTNWSAGLHLPWAVILDDGLDPGKHTATVRVAEGHHEKSTGTALRVFHLLLN